MSPEIKAAIAAIEARKAAIRDQLGYDPLATPSPEPTTQVNPESDDGWYSEYSGYSDDLDDSYEFLSGKLP